MGGVHRLEKFTFEGSCIGEAYSIYYEQANLSSQDVYFSANAIQKGILTFIKEYNYHSFYPNHSRSGTDIMKLIATILKVSKPIFNIKDIETMVSLSRPAAQGILKKLLKYSLLSKTSDRHRVESVTAKVKE